MCCFFFIILGLKILHFIIKKFDFSCFAEVHAQYWLLSHSGTVFLCMCASRIFWVFIVPIILTLSFVFELLQLAVELFPAYLLLCLYICSVTPPNLFPFPCLPPSLPSSSVLPSPPPSALILFLHVLPPLSKYLSCFSVLLLFQHLFSERIMLSCFHVHVVRGSFCAP